MAGMLCRHHDFTQLSFAGPLRQFVAELCMLTTAELTDGPLKEAPHPALGGKSPRYAMQTLGTEWGRDMIDSQLWVNAGLLKAQHTPGNVVISDVRFPNEAEAIRTAGGHVIRITRPELQSIESDHISEQGIPDSLVDYELSNSGDFGHLRWLVASLWDELVEGL